MKRTFKKRFQEIVLWGASSKTVLLPHIYNSTYYFGSMERKILSIMAIGNGYGYMIILLWDDDADCGKNRFKKVAEKSFLVKLITIKSLANFSIIKF